MKILGGALVSVVGLLAAGCGGTVTRTVVIRPCVSAKQMSACVQELTQRFASDSGSGGKSQVKCRVVGKEFSCLVGVSLPDGTLNCGVIVVDRLPYGVPYPARQSTVPVKACVTAFGAA